MAVVVASGDLSRIQHPMSAHRIPAVWRVMERRVDAHPDRLTSAALPCFVPPVPSERPRIDEPHHCVRRRVSGRILLLNALSAEFHVGRIPTWPRRCNEDAYRRNHGSRRSRAAECSERSSLDHGGALLLGLAKRRRSGFRRMCARSNARSEPDQAQFPPAHPLSVDPVAQERRS